MNVSSVGLPFVRLAETNIITHRTTAGKKIKKMHFCYNITANSNLNLFISLYSINSQTLKPKLPKKNQNFISTNITESNSSQVTCRLPVTSYSKGECPVKTRLVSFYDLIEIIRSHLLFTAGFHNRELPHNLSIIANAKRNSKTTYKRFKFL